MGEYIPPLWNWKLLGIISILLSLNVPHTSESTYNRPVHAVPKVIYCDLFAHGL